MTLLLAVAAGLLLGLGEGTLRGLAPEAPNLLAAALAVVLCDVGSQRSRPQRSTRAMGASFVGLLLGYSACSLEPANVFLLGGGIAAVALTAARRVLFVESVLAQAAFGLAAFAALWLSRELHAGLGLAPRLSWRPDGWMTPLLTALATPILVRAWVELRRVARWGADRAGELRDATGRPPPA